VKLTEAQSRELLQKHGVYVTEVCDKCGKALGPERHFTRFGEVGAWCSRECRDGAQAPWWTKTLLKRLTRSGAISWTAWHISWDEPYFAEPRREQKNTLIPRYKGIAY